MVPLIRPVTFMHRNTDERVTFTNLAVLEGLFDNRRPSDWMRIA